MKKKTFLLRLGLIGLIAYTPMSLVAQQDVTAFLRVSQQDATKLSEAYLRPFGKGLGWGLSGSWYNSGKPHKLGGFDLTFSLNTVIVPSSDKSFDVNSLGLNNVSLVTGQNSSSPTVSGGGSGPKVKYNGTVDVGGVPVNQSVQFTLPSGGNLSAIPVPILQAGVGLPFHTEIVGRFVPKTDIPDVGNVSLWGIGIKNEFKELIPGISLLPFSLSAMVGYTSFNSDIDISYKPEASAPSASYYNDQMLNIKSSAIATRLIISKSIPVLTVYAGLGYNITKTTMDLKGNFPVGLEQQGGNVVVSGNQNWTDPFSLSFKNNGVSANAGIRIKLAIIAFHIDYTLSKYSTVNAGIGINFR
ncbi:DUF6588 family protein [Williamwhitmania taraxaci]|uniref:Outer membrane protein beta-barrel domain-containing protein n=1 Tax=Williamwhitmania taraxaci TaxID=1640674 RepID=A0A1G6HJ36_9BACT|nr:DUF6588 family protein [Williamwhitmania taraxaci]SDB94163.1 hypothetical protein SAMN05216323_101144 [Williamwhitmania taraxaci]